MKAILSLRDRFFPPHQLIKPGIYQFTGAASSGFPYRLHLRVEPGGQSVLIANGSTVLQLNQTATEYVYHLVTGTNLDDMGKSVSKRYGITRQQARDDYSDLVQRLQTMMETPDLDPVVNLDFDQAANYSGASSAPYRLDCALTYRLPDTGASMYAPVDRVKRDLEQKEWETILDKAWEAGIPHAVFTGGEPTMRPDLIDLIKYASKLGMVTGLISNGMRLVETEYLHAVLQSGLDHLMLVLAPEEEQSWEALRDVLAEDLSVTVHLTITSNQTYEDGVILEKLAKMGVTNLSLSAQSKELTHKIPLVRQMIADRSLRLVWDLPVPYSALHPVALELEGEAAAIQAAGAAWIYVEPDGDVLRTQGDPTVFGNLLSDPWQSIWEKTR
jgi:organic radical activating enzyme